MPAERFYKDGELQGFISIEGPEHHHLAHVMRIRTGELVEVVNGKGALASAKVIAISKRDATLEILSLSHPPSPPGYLSLAIPLMRPSKLELVIEKCTELGCGAFYLYPADFSEKDDLSPHQFERLQLIAVSAMKQCGRLDLPPLTQLASLEEIFRSSASCWFGDTRPQAPRWDPEGTILFATGPEKGFSKRELNLLDQKGKGVKLHPNILRAETAPIVASVLCIHQ